VSGSGDAAGLLEPAESLERHRTELTAYCYRMLGSAFEAEDAVQETMTRAWRALDRFERRSALRTWLYRIASNVCLDMLGASQRRARPMDLTAPGSAEVFSLVPLPETTWIEPVPTGRVLPATGDPGDLAQARESLRLAFVAVLQHLPPRQRAVLILREALGWSAAEVAGLLDTTVASVNSALQRARATLAAHDIDEAAPSRPEDPAQRELLDRYVDAFQRYDMDALAAVVHEDATQTSSPGGSARATSAAARCWSPRPRTGCRPGASTSRRRGAGTGRGRSTWSRSRGTASPTSPSSWTRGASSRSSGSRRSPRPDARRPSGPPAAYQPVEPVDDGPEGDGHAERGHQRSERVVEGAAAEVADRRLQDRPQARADPVGGDEAR
jgi:RNA polymerase sigma-70 factor, ECF subfamily